MKTIARFLVLLSLFLGYLSYTKNISAHPGNTASDGCHYCRTNCDDWGVPWNERHCHNGTPAVNPTPPPVQIIYTPTPTKVPTPVPTKPATTKPTVLAKTAPPETPSLALTPKPSVTTTPMTDNLESEEPPPSATSLNKTINNESDTNSLAAFLGIGGVGTSFIGGYILGNRNKKIAS